MFVKLFLILAIGHISVRGSPFELLENYIEGFEKNMDHLRSYLKSGGWQQKTHQNYIREEEHRKGKLEKYILIIQIFNIKTINDCIISKS